MVILGVVLLILCLALVAGIGLSNTEPTNAEAFGVTLSNVSLGGLFLVGVTIGALAMLGLGLILVGLARKRHKRSASKREVKNARGESASLAEENQRLQQELERERKAGLPQTDGGAVADGSGQRGR